MRSCKFCAVAFTTKEWEKMKHKRKNARYHAACVIKRGMPGLIALAGMLMVARVLNDAVREETNRTTGRRA